MPRGRPSKELVETVKELSRQGMSKEDIISKTGASEKIVEKYMIPSEKVA